MSYCRYGEDSDVYVYPSAYGIVIYCSGNEETYRGITAAIDRLEELRAEGYLVPQRAIDRLLRESTDI